MQSVRRKRSLVVTYLFILLILTEVLLRSVLSFCGYSFFSPSEYIYDGYYTTLKPIAKKHITNQDEKKDILILGGSVVSPGWSRLEERLDSILTASYAGKKEFCIYNAAMPAHTSLDNWYKYQLLKDQTFDLVIFYEAINENRANNIRPEAFHADYSHISWYEEIQLLQAHPELDFTVIPYLVHKVVHFTSGYLNHKEHIHFQGVDDRYVPFGADIKTAVSYKSNLTDIVNTAGRRGDRLLLLSYASYFPPGIKLTGDSTDNQHFAGCRYATSVKLWGDPANVQKGIKVHNSILTNLAKMHSSYFLDMANLLPKQQALFCDVCHLSEAGAQRFAKELGDYLISSRILE